MIYSNRARDCKYESIISNLTNSVYLDYGYNPTWVYDRELQLRGVDVILRKDGVGYIVDEKAAITRLDGLLSTFAFELYTSNNKGNIGWLFNKNCINNYYSLIYLTSLSNNIRKIDRIECVLLNKYKILDIIRAELNKANIHFNNIIEIFKNINTQNNGKKYIRLNKYMKIVYSVNILPERPINILLDKDYLISLSRDVLVKEF